jgi:DNA-binding transcriptional regulator YiaG
MLKETRRWKENIHGLLGLDYLHFENVPMFDSEHGPIIDVAPGVLEKLAAHAIIQERIPIRGIELKFLRKTVGLSMERFASQLGLTSGAVFKWEHQPKERLHPTNEAVVRAFFAENLNIEISGKLSLLIGVQHTPKNLTLKAG